MPLFAAFQIGGDIRKSRSNAKKKQRQINQLIELGDAGKGNRQIIENPLAGLGKRLEGPWMDLPSYNSNDRDASVRVAGPSRNRVADLSKITLREDPNVEFGRLVDTDEDFGFGSTNLNDVQGDGMLGNGEDGLFGDPVVPIHEETTRNELMLPPPPPDAPARRPSQEEDIRIQINPIDQAFPGA